MRWLVLALTLASCRTAPPADEMPPAPPPPGGDAPGRPASADPADLRAAVPEAASDRLRPGDVIEFTVHGHPDLTTRVRLPADGKVVLPHVGSFGLGGRVIPEAQEALRAALERDVLVAAPVGLLVVEYAARTAFVLGNVKRPGAYPIPPASALTLLQALAHAGGFEADADRDGILLVRAGPDGKRRLYRLSYAAIEREGRLEADVPLCPDDALLVPGRGTVTVLGSVEAPGVFPIPDEGMTVTRAVALARGLTRFAAPNRAVVIRQLPGGASVPVRIALGEIMGGERPDHRLRGGDVVYIPESLF